MFTLALAAVLAGCASNHRNSYIPPDAPAVVLGGLRRDRDAAFSPQEQQIISAARQHLEEKDSQPLDAYYRVTHEPDHYVVYVQFVAGYDKITPYFMAGGFCVVLVGKDGRVIRVLPGA
ncbi:MAG: hypothetical protein ACO1QS_14290 [Verrucomicrobiota bacterium]